MNEMIILVSGLVNLGISFKFEMEERCGKDAMHVTFEKDNESFSIVWNFGTYGYDEGLLEAWTFNEGHTFTTEYGDPVGWLTAVDILAKLQNK